MKYLNILIVVLTLNSCSDDEGLHELQKNSPIQLEELIFSGCKGNKSTLTNDEYVVIEPVADDKIKIMHQNVKFNCCIDELTVDFNAKGKNLLVNESSSDPICNCICPYDIQFFIDNLEKGKYSLILTYHNIQKVKLTINIPLEEKLQFDL